jgi:DNA-binding transcriptional MerR regulator/methylmalonyl-CoA mutase cobalamin-binding subunit
MSTYSIKDLEQLSGIKAHTIRIWEQRYRLIEPSRTSANIRYYSDDDLVKLMNVSLLNKSGYKISKIAKLTASQINELILKLNETVPSSESRTSDLARALLEVDELLFHRVFESSQEHIGFEKTMEELLFPFFEMIGNLWLAGTIIPAQEHFITNLIRQKLIVAIDQERIRSAENRPRILFYLPEGEFHEIGMLYYNYLARKADFEVIYLGTSVPFRDIIKMDQIRPSRVIFTSFVTSLGDEGLSRRIERKRKAFPDKIFLVSGWQLKQQLPELPANFFPVSSSADFKKALDHVIKTDPSFKV